MRIALVVTLFALVWPACAGPQPVLVPCPPKGCAALGPPDSRQPALVEHAARDLECAPSQLDVDLENDDATVSGCGRSARYAWISGRYRPGRWILDSRVTTR